MGGISRTASQAQLQMLKSPSMRGFIHQSSKPPQSVASINITNLEDSEGLIRAYKKKKAEFEDLKERYYLIETELYTEKQRNRLFEDDVLKLRLKLEKTEKLLKEVQMKESRKDSDLLSKQLTLKSQEAQAYQSELQHQKSENGKLRDKIKDLMARGRPGSSASFSSNSAPASDDQLTAALREKDDLHRTLDTLKHQFTQSLQDSSDKYRRLDTDKSQIIARLEQQLESLRAQ